MFNEASCIDEDIRATTKSSSKIGAIWHIYKPQDSSTISKFLKKVFFNLTVILFLPKQIYSVFFLNLKLCNLCVTK